MNELVINYNEQAVTTSLKVANFFGKRHKDILETIRIMMAENSALQNMFEAATYVSIQNKTLPMYYMNRDGYSLLVMGFTGKKALRFKLQYIDAFNKMESIIRNEIAPVKPTNPLDVLQGMLDSLKNQDAKILAVEKRLDTMESEKREATEKLLSCQQYLSKEFAPTESERDMCRRLVNEYSSSTGISQQDVWHKVYADLYYTYHIRIPEVKNKSKLETAEKMGVIPQIHAIISTMVYNLNKNKQNENN